MALGLSSLIAGCSASATPRPTPEADRWDAMVDPGADPAEKASASSSDRGSLREQSRAVLGTPTDSSGVIAGSSQASLSRWTILICRVDISKPEMVQRTLDILSESLTDVRVTPRDGENFITMGEYTDPLSPKARADLQRVHNFTVTLGDRTVQPYRNAFIAPPGADELQGTNAAYDLRNVRARFGDKALYTLQFAIYGREGRESPTPAELESFRRAAEEAVVSLRREGEQAFYYHGPSRSTVTVGVFYEEDHDSTTRPPLESERLKAAREKHPLNLLNGQGVTQVLQDERGKKIRKPQPSFLVGIPKS